jgi:hypothetical protein
MKTEEFRSLTKGDTVTHKKYGLCEVVDFVNWWGAPKDPVLMPLTQEGKELLFQHSGMKEAPLVETNKNLIEGSDKIECSIESDINKFIEYETRERTVHFWGSDYKIKPQLVEEIEGDGLQVVWLQSLNERPDYKLLRIDSSHDVKADDFDYDWLIQMVENEFGDACEFEQMEINGKYVYVYREDLDDDGNLNVPVEDACIKDYVFSWDGGSWGSYGSFKDVDYSKILGEILNCFKKFIGNDYKESIDLTLELHMELPKAIRYTVMQKIQEANGIHFGENGDYHFWKIKEKDFPQLILRKEFLKLWYKPRIEAIKKTRTFLKKGKAGKMTLIPVAPQGDQQKQNM